MYTPPRGHACRPTVAAYTAGDLEVFRTVNARALAAAGAGPGSVVHNAYGYGLFTGGLGLHGGAELLGCAVIPISGGQTARQVVLVRDLRPEVLCCTPSYAALLGEALQEAGVTPAENPLRVGIFGAEPWTEQLRLRIETLHAITALDIYGLCEVIGPGVAFECFESWAELASGGVGGLHVNEDHFFVEAVNPMSGEPVVDGEVGELVFTTLTKEALPLVRYRSGDLLSLNGNHAPVAGRRCVCPDCSAGATTCSSYVASTSFPPRSKPSFCPRLSSGRTTRSCSTHLGHARDGRRVRARRRRSSNGRYRS